MKRVINYCCPLAVENDYVHIMQDALQALGNEVVPVGWHWVTLRACASTGTGTGDMLILNWPENYVLRQGKPSVGDALRTVYMLLWARRRWKKLVYVMHNHRSHALGMRSRLLTGFIVKLASRLADKTIVHSPHLAGGRYCYVPHPLYPVRADSTMPGDFPFSASEDFFLVMGRLNRYKMVEEIISTWPTGKNLLITGTAPDEGYLHFLKSGVEARGLNAHIRFLPRYLDESEIAWLMKNTTACILSHQTREMIVSGAFFHALSYGTNLIARSSAFYSALIKQNIFTDFIALDDWHGLSARFASVRVRTAEERAAVAKRAEAVFGREAVLSHLNEVIN